MARTVEEFVARLGWEVKPGAKRKLQDYEGAVDGILKGFAALAAAAAAAGSAIVALSVATNKQTAITANLAKSVGIAADTLDALDGVVQNIGFDYEKVVDLVEEMNNKLGESAGLKPITPVVESLKILNLQFKDLKKLKPEDQFIKILDAAKELKDVQKAVSAVDILMGGDANKILGFLRTQEGSLADIIKRQKELNFLTDEGRAGAVEFTAAFGELGKSVSSIWKQFSGLLGQALSPLIKEFTKWIRENKKLIKQRIRVWVNRLRKAIVWLKDKIKLLKPVIKRLVAIFKILGMVVAAAAVLKTVIIIQKIAAAWRLAGTAALFAQAKMLLIPLAIVALLLAIEDLYLFLEGSDKTLTFEYLTKLEEWLGMDLVGPIRAAWPGIKAFWAGWWDLIVGFFTAMGETAAAAVMFVANLFTKGLGPAWDTLVEHMTDVWGRFGETLKDLGIVNFLKYIWEEFIGWFRSTVFDPITDFVQSIADSISGLAGTIKSTLAALPGIGGLFGDVVANPAESASSNIAAATASVSNITNSMQNVSRPRYESFSRVDVGEIVITASPGQSPEDIGHSVKKVLQEEMASAVRANSTGVQR